METREDGQDRPGSPSESEKRRRGHLERALGVECPVIVVLAEKEMTLEKVLALRRDTVIAFSKPSDSALDLYVSDRKVASGRAVRVGPRYGLWLESVGSARDTVASL